jgi:alpha-glucosidase (family GH31 glycosyl hydrolase)
MSKLLDMKHQMMPYLYDLVRFPRWPSTSALIDYQGNQAHLKGYPLQRAMFIEFPDDRTTHTLERQYMLGSSLLVAPVFVPSEEESEYYLPAGRWTYLWSNGSRIVEGPKWIKEFVPLDEIPIWVRSGTVLCLGPKGIGRPDYDYSENVRVNVYDIAEGQTVKTDIPEAKGGRTAAPVTVSRTGTEIRVKLDGKATVSSLNIFDKTTSVRAVEGGSQLEAGDGRISVTVVEQGVKEIVCSLA